MHEKFENAVNCSKKLSATAFTLAKLQSQLVFLLSLPLLLAWFYLIVFSQNHIVPRRQQQKHSAFCCCHWSCRHRRRRCSTDKINYKTVSDQKIHLANRLESISLNWRIHFGHVSFRSPILSLPFVSQLHFILFAINNSLVVSIGFVDSCSIERATAHTNTHIYTDTRIQFITRFSP